MSRIRAKNTHPELALRKRLFCAGFRYTLHNRKLPGSPDLLLPKYGAAVFVHGCFWHRHAGCPLTTAPSTNVSFWTAKFESNVARDARNVKTLVAMGWRVLIVWECDLADNQADATAQRVGDWLRLDALTAFPSDRNS